MAFFCCVRSNRTRRNKREEGDHPFQYVEVKKCDYSHSGLLEVPDHIFLQERTLELLFVNSNRIERLPWSVFSCHNLKVLDVSDNNIRDLPEAFECLTALERLNASHNLLENIPTQLKSLKHLKCLDLSRNRLNSFPEVITQMCSLEELYVSDQCLRFLPANIGRLRNLKVLEVRDSGLRTIPFSFDKLTNLVKLDIGMNDIRRMPESICSLRHLEELWFDFNDAQVLTFIGNLYRLKTCDLEFNEITYVPREIGNLRNVTYLSLAGNVLKDVPREIGDLKHLITLKLSENYIQDLPISIGNLTRLEELDVSCNLLVELPTQIGYLRNLHTLNANTNLITYLPREIGSCTNLRVLTLDDNRLKVLPAEMGHLHKLTVLSLVKNVMKYFPLSFSKLSNLRSLWLSFNQGNPMTPLVRQYDPDAHEYVMTSFLLPQCNPDAENMDCGENQVMQNYQLLRQQKERQKSGNRIKFSADAVDEKAGASGLCRVPTPIPKKMKELKQVAAMSQGVTEGTSNDNEENGELSPSSTTVHVDVEIPPNSKIVKTAVVRRQPIEDPLTNSEELGAASNSCKLERNNLSVIYDAIHTSDPSNCSDGEIESPYKNLPPLRAVPGPSASSSTPHGKQIRWHV